MKTYKFYVSFEPVIIYAKDIRSALGQLKKEVGLKYYNLRRIYVVNEQVRYLNEGFFNSLVEIKRQIEVGTK